VAVHRHREYGELEPLPVPTGPFKTVTMDFIIGLPAARHQNSVYDAILVVVDTYTKWALYVPCTKDIDAPELAELLFETVFSKYRVPKRIVSDRGSLFTSAFWASLCYYIGTQRRLSTVYHLQTDGQTERQNQMLEHYLHCYVNYLQDDWP
jgi:transposase InsO family protein